MPWMKNKWGEWVYEGSSSEANLEFPSRRASRTNDSASEPVTLSELKAQVRVSGTEHDNHLALILEAARRAWEQDTGKVLINQTYTLDIPGLVELRFREYPVASVTSVKYYDSSNVQQTLSTDIYELDAAENSLRLKPDQIWPTTYSRYDGIEIIYVVGENSDNSEINSYDKMAILLCAAQLFFYPVDGLEKMEGAAIGFYERMRRRSMRTSYP